ncbi:MAG: mandelate racemase/muconate lactonizing enzyme family protein [Betaproteobacteria bacterium]|nr:mandelate racemase/muconate lactonizing enzyme family protein [Betaproteobacteria bacterium]
MRIEAIETRLYRVPPTVRISDAIQSIHRWEWIITTVRTDTGLVGRGWTYTLGIGGTAIRAIVEDYLAPLLMGSDARDIDRIWNRCWLELHANGSGGFTTLAIATIDIALHDLMAQQAGLPLWKLLGGARERIPAYGSGINMHLDGEPLAEQMRGFLERGYRAVKMKVGRDDAQEDVERVATVRKVIGPKTLLMLDANQKWTPGEAIQRVRMLEQFNPYWIEEPVLADDIPGHARVRAGLGTPVAIGETLFTRYQFADYIRAGAVDIVQADVPRVGGFTEWMKIARLAEAHNLPVAPHFAVELSVHALCAVNHGLILEDLQGGSLTDLGLLEEPWRVENGWGVPPARPGLGYVWNERALAKYEVTGKITDFKATRAG